MHTFILISVLIVLSAAHEGHPHRINDDEAHVDTPLAACTFKSYDDIKDVKSCNPITLQGPFTVPANKKIDLTGLASGTKVDIRGEITFAKGTLDKDNFLITFGGDNLAIDGTGATLNGNGPEYWDGQGGNGGVPKPKFIRLNGLNGGSFKALKIVGSPIQTFSVKASDFTIDGVTIDNRGTNYDKGHNTDGFDVSGSKSLTIQNVHVYNNDDCLAVNSGTDINFKNNYCSGGHGVSIGSVKSGDVVDGVTVTNTQIVDSDNGVRIKTYNDADNAHVNNIKYDGITLSGIGKYGIIIQQDYTNSGSTGVPGKNCPITNVVLNNIKGSMKGGEAEYILCGNCKEFTFTGISITGASKASNCTGISPKPMGC
jgi:galacturan 1,4-alpha-galacturonidase